ncbi:hypothetical protein MTR67_045748 [Solanum verrucosum]|uniref:RNase H type-1 domain-containing protein n=1 Tax=Solanum verrucosum TaxID=315347 RepID=A0AAF0UW35_SOLVR|nr:hypothetical protein MTR67_045748 [Solanum verrucosum]
MELGTMQRCRTSYEIAQFSISRPLELASMTLKTRSFGTSQKMGNIPTAHNIDQSLADLLKPSSNLSIVCWKFPENGVLKLKTDGSYCPASGKSGMRGVLRDDRGNLIFAFSSPSSGSSITEAEAKAASYGLRASAF